uniref:Uncharacterized protein n=1 Tax=Anopheles dirus TaxID=7168 RepID=A0A182N136_9DIPT
MSGSLSTMPFSRQYGSFRVTSTTAGGTGGPNAAPSSNGSGGVHRHHGAIARHSSGSEQQPALQMAPLGYRMGNPVRNANNNWLNNSKHTATRATYAAHQQQKSTQQPSHHHHHHHLPAPAQQEQPEVTPHPDRCAMHRGPVRPLGEPIADTPLLQSPRIIARSAAARIVEPNAWNRRLTTSNFCALAGATTSSRLVCRKSPGSSGTSVESIVPKYTRPAAAVAAAATTPATTTTAPAHAESTTAQKRTYNAHKPQLRVTNTNGRIGTVAKKLTGGHAAATNSSSTASASQHAEREVAMVLHHHNMRVIDMLNNNHLQQQQQQTSRAAARSVKENNENYQPAHGGGQKQLPGVVAKKGSAIPQRLPLTDRDQPTTDRNKRLLLGGAAGGAAAECFSSKFPNGLPFEQEFYYRRPQPPDDDGHRQEHPGGVPEKPDEDGDEHHKHHQHHQHHHPYHQQQQRARNGPKKHVLLPRRGRLPEQHVRGTHRSRSVSGEVDGAPSSPPPPPHDQRRSVSAAVDRLPDDEDALYVDFTKRRDPHQDDEEEEEEDDDGGGVSPPTPLLQTSVVEYRNINHSSYYYKFESVSQRKGLAAGAGSRSRYHRSRLGLNRPVDPATAADVNGNAAGREYYDDDGGQCAGEENRAEDEEEEEGEAEEEGERSTVYVAVATWVPKCNRLPKESGENNNSICLTLATNGTGEKVDQQQQQQHSHRPTRIAVAAPSAPALVGRTTQHGTATAPVAPSSYGQL